MRQEGKVEDEKHLKFIFFYERKIQFLLTPLCFSPEGASDRLGVQEGEETRERIGPHVPHGCDVSDHH